MSPKGTTARQTKGDDYQLWVDQASTLCLMPSVRRSSLR